MIRLVEKRNYRSKIETCWDVSDKLENCVRNSENFSKLNIFTKPIVLYAIGKNYFRDYIRMFGNPAIKFEKATLFYDEESTFWTKNNPNTEKLKLLKEECDLYALHECCKANYNLESLAGDYEYIGQFAEKK